MLTKDASTQGASTAKLLRQMVADAQRLRDELADDPNADSIAQAAVCAAAILAAAKADFSRAITWLQGQLAPWELHALKRAAALSRVGSAHHLIASAVGTAHPADPAHLYEPFLHRYSPSGRQRRGVFFTPRPIADYIVASTARLLREECGIAAGLADESAQIIDPACGTGVFPLAVIEHLRRTAASPRAWNDTVNALLPRLVGIEILPAAALLAKLNIALKLAETGYDFAQPGQIRIITGDALQQPTQSQIPNPKSQIPVLLGNPPFSSLSTNTNSWIARLLRGDEEIRGYVRANGQQLNERKTWLHDDYVKFIRLAQWHVEQAGAGIVGFVTNHGYLDNATFRLMRHELLRVFPRIQIVDLHGNRKKHEVAPDGARDENVFQLDQGVAIGLFCRPSNFASFNPQPASFNPQPKAQAGLPDTVAFGSGLNDAQLEYSELWGVRDAKLAAIADPSIRLRASVLRPSAPDWRFTPSQFSAPDPEYAAAWSLAEAMPISTTAPVTARDHFVVGFTAEELKSRIAEFRDLSIPDDEIRRRYFHRTRSARYQSGDTRGWKLSQARRIVAADAEWQSKIIRCLYRPFDWRYVFWHPAMIDWPRNEVTRHLIDNRTSDGETEGPSDKPGAKDSASLRLSFAPSLRLALLARRQQLPTQSCTFFWIADGLALDGVIRSDNRGSESLFPLYVLGTLRVPLPTDGTRSVPATDWRANFTPAFIEQFTRASQLAWLPLGRGDLRQTFGPEDLLAYIYALFHSPTYRERHAEALRYDFPRILPPRSTELFRQLCDFGGELIDLHLLRERRRVGYAHHFFSTNVVGTAHPTTPNPDPRVSSFRAGGYVALHKWLQPKHRSASDPEYSRIARAIARTLEIMATIDAALAPVEDLVSGQSSALRILAKPEGLASR